MNAALAPPLVVRIPLRRNQEAAADPLFVERWSPRAFAPEPVARETLLALFEAARWAPSSRNEQPWRFVYAVEPADRARFASLLMEGNRAWAAQAPALVFLLAKTNGSRGAPNPWAKFDAGAAWMSLALQARMLGLDTHAMAGIDRDLAHQVLGVPPDVEVLIGIAVGRRGDAARLPERLALREAPSPRHSLRAVASEGRYSNLAPLPPSP